MKKYLHHLAPRFFLLLIFGLAVLNPLTRAEDSQAPRNEREKKYLKLWLKYLPKLEKRVKALENRAASAEAKITEAATAAAIAATNNTASKNTSAKTADKNAEVAVDLSKPEPAPVAQNTPESKVTHSGTATKDFRVYFDLNLIRRPGVEELSFDTFHSFLFFEAILSPEIQFTFDVSAAPRFYELDWQVNSRLQLRAGKINIPFDDLSPHNIYGGRANVSKLALGPAFLPDIWADLGVGLKYNLITQRNFSLISHLYVVNGFRSGGVDPTGSGNAYPSFSDLPSSADNNRDKAIGTRLQAVVYRRWSIGTSYYTESWSDEGKPYHRLNIIGFDSQYKLPNATTEIRLGIINMAVKIDAGTFYRGGTYAEIGQKLRRESPWKVLLRGGTLQEDDRVINNGDERLLGAAILYQPNAIQFSLEHSEDLERVGTKKGYSFTNLRMVVAL